MDKHKHVTASLENQCPLDSSAVAESVRSDFSELVELFGRHLDDLAHDDSEERRHILEAKAAAERGLRLSLELIAAMKAANSSV